MALGRTTRSLMELADEELMQLLRRGDSRAFEIVYERHSGAAFSLAYRMTGKRVTAEEVVQEAFLALWRANARYDRTRGSVRTWILGIVHNRAIDALRRGMVHDRRRAPRARRGRAPRPRRGEGGGLEERCEARERPDGGAPRHDEAREVRSAL